MDSNSDKLTLNMTKNTNLTLLENGFLNGPKTQKMDLMPKMEKNEGAEINAKYGKAANLFKKLGGKTYDFVEKSWQRTKNSFSSINYNYLVSLFNTFMVATFLLLVPVLFTTFFFYVFIGSVNFLLKITLRQTIFLGSLQLFGYFGLLCYYFIFVYKMLLSFKPALVDSKWFSLLFKFVPNFFMGIFSILLFIIIFSANYCNIMTFATEFNFYPTVRIVMTTFCLFCVLCGVKTYSDFLNNVVAKYPFTMNSFVIF
ncbi:unnamed protein product [Meloidogyne enterolobii]|uniref:Uncharacterized protein n=1 Tax=Meloidogyne enterolobii TaxID=390850 RepID=A0ACB1AWS4_MELEN